MLLCLSVAGASAPSYDDPRLAAYELYRTSAQRGDAQTILYLARESSSFLRYRAARHLTTLDTAAEVQLEAYRIALELHPYDSLDRRVETDLRLGLAASAERVGNVGEAVEAYSEALPHERAVAGLKRLEQRPLKLAQQFMDARLYEDALDALGDRAVPSLEATAQRRLGNYREALDAYERWLAEEPANATALLGKAWTLFYLEENEAADALFASLSDDTAHYGRGLIAQRRGDAEAAVTHLSASDAPYHLWLAANLLEERDYLTRATEPYRRLAASTSPYADDAAYRLHVLHERYGVGEAAEPPPTDSLNQFFRLKLGLPLELPAGSSLPARQPEVLALADALVKAGDSEAATGELVAALRRSEDEATAMTLAEKLQALGEFRQSQLAAERYLRGGSRDLRTWRAAFPRAYRQQVEAAALTEATDPALIWAVMWQESRFVPRATSRTGAKGLMQFVPSTWTWVAELRDETPGDPYDPEQSIRYGATYLAWLSDYFGGDLELIIPAYNGGQGYIRRTFESEQVAEDKDDFYRFIDRLEPREYLQSVSYVYEVYKALYAQ